MSHSKAFGDALMSLNFIDKPMEGFRQAEDWYSGQACKRMKKVILSCQVCLKFAKNQQKVPITQHDIGEHS